MIKINDSNVTLMITDMSAAIKFYESLGLTLVQRWDDHYAMMTAGKLTIGLHPADGGPTGSGASSIGFFIDNIDDARAVLDVIKTPYKEEDGKSGHYLNFEDPWGNHLYFVKPGW
jgi:catechol 2,3-dioxygenase-like lactoylglutathione lyase family enzyme